MKHQFLHFNASQPPEQASLLGTASAPNMVVSYITTSNNYKMTAPNKGTALWGSVDVCPDNTLTWQAGLLVIYIHANERKSQETQAARKRWGTVCFCLCGSSKMFRRTQKKVLQHWDHFCSLLRVPSCPIRSCAEDNNKGLAGYEHPQSPECSTYFTGEWYCKWEHWWRFWRQFWVDRPFSVSGHYALQGCSLEDVEPAHDFTVRLYLSIKWEKL